MYIRRFNAKRIQAKKTKVQAKQSPFVISVYSVTAASRSTSKWWWSGSTPPILPSLSRFPTNRRDNRLHDSVTNFLDHGQAEGFTVWFCSRHTTAFVHCLSLITTCPHWKSRDLHAGDELQET